MDARKLTDVRYAVNEITNAFNVKTFDASYAKYVESKSYDKGNCLIFNDKFYRTKKDGIIKDVVSECESITPEEGMSILKPSGIDDDPIGSVYCVNTGGSIFQFIYDDKTSKYNLLSENLLFESDYDFKCKIYDSIYEYETAVANGDFKEHDIAFIADPIAYNENESLKYQYPKVCLRCGAPLDPANEVVNINYKYIKCKYCGCANYPIECIN